MTREDLAVELRNAYYYAFGVLPEHEPQWHELEEFNKDTWRSMAGWILERFRVGVANEK